MKPLVPRPVFATVEELLAAADQREDYRPADLRSPARFERVTIDGQPHVVKYVHLDTDFAMRAAGDLACLTRVAWAAGLMDVADDIIDTAVVGVASGYGRCGWGAVLLMRDVSGELVPQDGSHVPEDLHLGFFDHLAAFSARLWGWQDDVGLMPYGTRWGLVGPSVVETERDRGFPEAVPRIAFEGWQRFAERAPAEVWDGILELNRDSSPLAEALQRTPSTLLHGDWKFGNLGTAADGRTVLLDWAYPGQGPVCHELGWYLALNRARLPEGHTKERAIDDFRAALHRHGVETSPWWDVQLDLCLLGTLVQFGWEKALGDDEELAWWCDRAREGLRQL